MANFNITNNRVILPTFPRFTGSNPLSNKCYKQENPLIAIENRAYYYSGSVEPKVGDIVYEDINGLIPYSSNLNFVFFKQDDEFDYSYKIVNSIIQSIDTCQRIDFVEFEVLDQSNVNICGLNSFFPDDLTSDSEIFYHTGEGEFPIINKFVYISNSLESPLVSFTGLYKILNGVYYYFITNSNGLVIEIKTCTKPASVPIRSIQVRPAPSIFLCKEPETNFITLYYESEQDFRPAEGSTIYVNSDLSLLSVNKSYHVKNFPYSNSNVFLNTDSDGKVSYNTCFEINPPDDPDPDPDVAYYFYGKLAPGRCGTSFIGVIKFYYNSNDTTGANGSVPPLTTQIYEDENLSIIYGEIHIILSIQNGIATFIKTTPSGKLSEQYTCRVFTGGDEQQ